MLVYFLEKTYDHTHTHTVRFLIHITFRVLLEMSFPLVESKAATTRYTTRGTPCFPQPTS